MGYYDSDVQKGTYKTISLPWRVHNNSRDIPYDKLFWVICICPTCYEQFLCNKNKDPHSLCSSYIRDVIANFNSQKMHRKNKIKTNHKRNAYNHIRAGYKWLRDIIRKC